MLFLLILTLCYSVSSFDLEKTINNLKDGKLVNGLLDGFMKNKDKGEEIMENLENFEKNLELFNSLSFGRYTDVPSRTQRDDEEKSLPIHRFCERIDLECCCNHCGGSDCDSDLPDSFDWSQHVAMPAMMGNNSDDLVAGVIAHYTALRYNMEHHEVYPKLAAEQLTDCKEDWEDKLSWAGAVSRLMIQGGFELDKDYQADKNGTECRFDENKIAAHVTSCYQLNIEKENCLKDILVHLGPVLVGLRKANWDNDRHLQTDCNAVLDTYTPYILYGYAIDIATGVEAWLLSRPEGKTFKSFGIPTDVACQDIGMYTLILDVL